MSRSKNLNDLSQFVEKNYGLEKAAVSLLRNGVDNDLYLIQNSNSKSVLRIGKREMGKLVQFEIHLLNHLATDGVPVPKIIPTINGKKFILNKFNKVSVCFEFIDGKSYEVTNESKPSLDVVKQAGKALGKFHKSTESFQNYLNRRRNIYTEFNRIASKKSWLEKYIEGGVSFLSEVDKYIKWSQLRKNNVGVIHNDYGPDNIMVMDGNLTAIIDFDWAGPGPFAKDVGLALALWSLPDYLNSHWKDVVDQFLLGYNLSAPTPLLFDEILIRWINFCCLSNTATFFADLSEGNEKITRITQCRRYKKFLYFNDLLND